VTDSLREEALAVGCGALREHGEIPRALYEVYMQFRLRFIQECGLMDSPPGGAAWVEALCIARALERAVAADWATTILEARR